MIQLTIPTTDWNRIRCLGSAIRLCMSTEEVDLAHHEGSPIHVARNEAAANFVKTDHEWMLWADDDVLIPENAAKELLAVRKPIVSAVVPIMAEEGLPAANVFHRVGDEVLCHELSEVLHRSEPFQIDFCGFGCVLVHRKVFEKVPFPWFSYEHVRPDLKIGEDIYFSAKAGQAGFEIWCQPSVVCDHFKSVGLLSLHKAIQSEKARWMRLS